MPLDPRKLGDIFSALPQSRSLSEDSPFSQVGEIREAVVHLSALVTSRVAPVICDTVDG